jgi:hypothetical protein
MTHDEIISLYDTSPNMTLKELSRITGWPVARLKKLLTHQG